MNKEPSDLGQVCKETISAIRRQDTLYVYHQDQRVGYSTRTDTYRDLVHDGIVQWYEQRKANRCRPKVTQRRLDQYLT